jgi:type IV fimbrial biogenesis protein FimT
MGRERGFTLLELLVTIAVLAILAAVALPSFSNMIRQNRSASEANNFLSILTYARSESIKRNRNVTLCKVNDTSACGGIDLSACSCDNSASWNSGIMVYTRDDADENDIPLQVVVPFSTNSSIVGNSNFVNTITYTASGQSTQSGRFTISPANNSNCPACKREVIVSTTGRPRIETP